MGDIGQEIEGITKQNTFHVGDSLYPGDVRVDLSFLFDVTGVIDSHTIEQVHQDNNNEEDEGEKEDIGQDTKVGVTVDGNVTELQLSYKHG